MVKPPAPPKPADDRNARLAAALRDNLKKRKAQARARESEATTEAPPPPVAPPKPMG